MTATQEKPGFASRPLSRLPRIAGAVAIASATAIVLAGCAADAAENAAETPAALSENVNEDARALVPDDIIDSGVLTMTADFAYPPFTYMEDGEMAGSDYELGNYIAEALGLTPEWTTESSFAAIVPSVQNGRVDAALESMNITEERLEAVSFVGYITTYDALLVNAGNPAGLDNANLCGSTLAVATGGASNPLLEAYSETCVDAGLEEITLVEFGTTDDMFLALQSNRVEGISTGSAPAAVRVEGSNGALELVGPVTLLDSDELMRSAVAGVVISKDRPELGQAIEMVIAQMQDEGEFLELLLRHGFDEDAVVAAEFVE